MTALFPRDLLLRALKQRVAEPRPTCHYCGKRVPVNALVRDGAKLIKPTYRNHLFGARTFRPHKKADGAPCPGSGQKLCIARGFDR